MNRGARKPLQLVRNEVLWTRVRRLRDTGRAARAESGQSLALFAVALTALVAIVGLVLDGGNLDNYRRKAQNAADAAAFAGAYDLPAADCGQATTDADQYLTLNPGNVNAINGTPSCSTTYTTDDTFTVTVNRNVPYSFMQVIGLSSGTVSATAKVRVAGIAAACAPAYATWFHINTGNTIRVIQAGDVVIIKDNKWVQNTVNKANDQALWQDQSGSFKGFTGGHGTGSTPACKNGVDYSGSNMNVNGITCSLEQPFLAAMQVSYSKSQLVIVAVLDSETGTGSNMTVGLYPPASFAAVQLNYAGNSNASNFTCNGTLQGKVVKTTTSGGVIPGGACNSTTISCVPVLIQ